MFRDKKITAAIIVVLIISVIGLGIAFAAFSQTLTINGSGTVESSSWSVVFEGADGSNTIGAPTLTGTATEVTHPTIKNNSTEISTYEVTLKTPGDSVTYNFKIHNKGDYAADLTSLTVAGKNRPSEYVNGSNLVTNSSVAESNYYPLIGTQYSFYYTSDNIPVGQYGARDCLEPGESVNVSLKLKFSETSEVRTNRLPSADLVLDNLGILAVYTQTNNGSCQWEQGETVENAQFKNNDRSYYTYEGKSFKGTGLNNIIITEDVIGEAKYASAAATQCSDGSVPTGTNDNTKKCPEGTTPVFLDHPALDMAEAYCTGCRLMTRAEAEAWGCSRSINPRCAVPDNHDDWWLVDNLARAKSTSYMSGFGTIGDYRDVASSGYKVRPVVDISSTATMTGSGTQQDPYVITTN